MSHVLDVMGTLLLLSAVTWLTAARAELGMTHQFSLYLCIYGILFAFGSVFCSSVLDPNTLNIWILIWIWILGYTINFDKKN